MTTSPLEEVNPKSLDELFSSAPMGRSPQEWSTIVETLRAKRALWAQEAAAATPRAARGKKASSAGASAMQRAMISVDDLDFGF